MPVIDLTVLRNNILRNRSYQRGKAVGSLAYVRGMNFLGNRVNGFRGTAKDVNWSAGYNLFEGLEDPFQEYEFKNGGNWVRASTASVLLIERASWNGAIASLRNKLLDLQEGGIIGPSPMGEIPLQAWMNTIPSLRGFDPRINEPAKFMSVFPWYTDSYFSDPGNLRKGVPVPKNVPPLYITEKATNPTMYPTSRMIGDMVDILNAIVQAHRAANANPMFSPACYMTTQQPSDFTNWMSDMDRFVQYGFPEKNREQARVYWSAHDVDREGERDVRRGDLMRLRAPSLTRSDADLRREDVISHTPLYSKYVPFCVMRSDLPANTASFFTNGQNFPLWMTSAERRQRITTDNQSIRERWNEITGFDGSNEIFPVSYQCDALGDFARIIQLANFILSCPPHVLVHSTMGFHNALVRIAFDYTGMNYSTDLAEYKRLMDAEFDATKRAAAGGLQGSILQGFSIVGAANDSSGLNAATVMSLPLAAASAAGPYGAIVAVAIIAVISLIDWLSGSTVYQRRLDGEEMNDRKEMGIRGIRYRGYTSENVIQNRPVLRLNQ